MLPPHPLVHARQGRTQRRRAVVRRPVGQRAVLQQRLDRLALPRLDGDQQRARARLGVDKADEVVGRVCDAELRRRQRAQAVGGRAEARERRAQLAEGTALSRARFWRAFGVSTAMIYDLAPADAAADTCLDQVTKLGLDPNRALIVL